MRINEEVSLSVLRLTTAWRELTHEIFSHVRYERNTKSVVKKIGGAVILAAACSIVAWKMFNKAVVVR